VPDVLTLNDPRDIDSVLLRVPSGLRRRVKETAKDQNVSQNTYITASLLFSAIVVGVLPRLGIPKNFQVLLVEMDRAAAESDAVLSGLHEKDWAEVRPILELFAASGIIEGLKARQDTSGADTVAFTFHFSKSGLNAWRILGPLLTKAADGVGESLFSVAGKATIS